MSGCDKPLGKVIKRTPQQGRAIVDANHRTSLHKRSSMDCCWRDCRRGDNHTCRVKRSRFAGLASDSRNPDVRPRSAVPVLSFPRFDDLRIGIASYVFPDDQSDRLIISLRDRWILRWSLPPDRFTGDGDPVDYSCWCHFVGDRVVSFSTGCDQCQKLQKRFMTWSWSKCRALANRISVCAVPTIGLFDRFRTSSAAFVS